MKNEYKKAFRLVVPDDNSIERIFIMTKRKVSFKPLLVVAVIIAILISCIVSVNAATDGKVVEAIKESKIYSNITVFVNGEKKSSNEIDDSIFKDFVDDVKINGKSIVDDTEHSYTIDIDEDGNYYSIALYQDEVVAKIETHPELETE